MKELYSKALVLSRVDFGEADSLVHLFTENFGKIVARAKSIRKISSKLSSHFQPLSFVKVRVLKSKTNNDRFILIDGITDDFSNRYSTNKRYDLLKMINFIDKYSFDLQKDNILWNFLIEVFSKNYNMEKSLYVLLKIFGISDGNDSCAICGNKNITAFYISEEKFMCRNCSSKFGKDDILYICKN